MSIKRTCHRLPIPDDVAERVLIASEYTCCICRGRPVTIHHINGDPSDNRDNNLAVLCHNHHDEAHTRRSLSRNLTAKGIAKAKQRWESEVVHARADRVSLDSDGQMAFRYWTYHNSGLLLDLCDQADVPTTKNAYFADLRRGGVVDERGIPTVTVPPNHNGLVRTIYSDLEQTTAQRLNQYFARLTDRLIQAAAPVHVDLSWPKRAVKRMLLPGRLVFLSRDFRFRVVHQHADYEQREARAKANGTAVVMQFDTRTIFSTSSLTLHFTGHGVIAALLLVRSAAKDMENPRVWLVKATPVALGVGFPHLTGPKPAIAYQKEAEAENEDIGF